MSHDSIVAKLRITPVGPFHAMLETITLVDRGNQWLVKVVARERFGDGTATQRLAIPVEESVVRNHLALLKGATVPAYPCSPMTLDGEEIELTVHGEGSSLTLQWWTIVPTGAEVVGEFVQWLRGVVKQGVQNGLNSTAGE